MIGASPPPWPAGDPRRAGLLLDFDGVLAPIVAEPEAARLGDALAGVLSGLAARLALVAVVSGRPAGFLAGQVADHRVRLIGLYGMEEARDGIVTPRPEAAAWAEAVATARAELVSALGGVEGVLVEDKGLSVAAHWRNAADHAHAEAVVDALVGDMASRTGLAREPGKYVVELRPPVAWDKGRVVDDLAAEADLREVAYLGDDLGDLAAFAAVRRRGGLAVAVDHGAETPPELLAAATVTVSGTVGVREWLTGVRDRLAAT